MTDPNPNLPAVRAEDDNRMTLGATELDAGDLILPRIKVVQKMSDETNDGRAKEGELFNTLTGENYGTELRFIPILPFKQRVFLVRDERRAAINAGLTFAGLHELSEGNGLKCRSFDMVHGRGDPGIDCGECPMALWRDNEPPLCTETYNVAAMTELGELIILSFAKTGAKTGKRLFSMLRMRPGPAWQAIYEVHTRSEKNDRGTFAVPEVTVTKDATPSELLTQALVWARQLHGVQIDVTPTDEEAEATAPAPF